MPKEKSLSTENIEKVFFRQKKKPRELTARTHFQKH
jgi:hypothetical protein